MEATLDAAPCAFLGDAYLFAMAALRGTDGDDEQSHARWNETALPTGDPLRADAAHFRAPNSLLLFEPQDKGGVGATAYAPFLEAGVVATGHCCRRVHTPTAP